MGTGMFLRSKGPAFAVKSSLKLEGALSVLMEIGRFYFKTSAGKCFQG